MHVDSIRSDRLPVVLAAGRRQWGFRDLLIAIAATGLIAAGYAAAEDSSEPVSQEVAVPAAGQSSLPEKPGKSGKVCRYEDVTGSRMKKRICYSSEQWEARERAAKDMVRELDAKPVGKDGHGS